MGFTFSSISISSLLIYRVGKCRCIPRQREGSKALRTRVTSICGTPDLVIISLGAGIRTPVLMIKRQVSLTSVPKEGSRSSELQLQTELPPMWEPNPGLPESNQCPQLLSLLSRRIWGSLSEQPTLEGSTSTTGGDTKTHGRGCSFLSGPADKHHWSLCSGSCPLFLWMFQAFFHFRCGFQSSSSLWNRSYFCLL